MENTAYEIAQWVSNNPIYLLVPAGLAAAGMSYIALTFDPEKHRKDKGLVNKLDDSQGKEK